MYSRKEAVSFLDDMAQEWECSREQWQAGVDFLNSMPENFTCKLLVGNDAVIEFSWETTTNKFVVYINEDGNYSLYVGSSEDLIDNIPLDSLLNIV